MYHKNLNEPPKNLYEPLYPSAHTNKPQTGPETRSPSLDNIVANISLRQPRYSLDMGANADSPGSVRFPQPPELSLPGSEFKTGLPTDLSSLIADLNPTLVTYAFFGTALALHGGKYLKNKVDNLICAWKDWNNPIPDYIPAPDNYKRTSEGASLFEPFDPSVSWFKNAHIDEAFNTQEKVANEKVSRMLNLLVSLLDESILQRLPNEPNNRDWDYAIHSNVANVLVELGNAGLKNETLNKIKALPPDILRKIIEIVNAEKPKHHANGLEDLNGWLKNKNTNDLDLSLDSLKNYMNQRLGSLDGIGLFSPEVENPEPKVEEAGKHEPLGDIYNSQRLGSLDQETG